MIRNHGKASRGSWLLLCGLVLCLGGRAQEQEEDASRRFWPPSFRPAPAGGAATPSKPARYKHATPMTPGATSAATVGVTVWQLRPAKPSDEARILGKKSAKTESWAAARVEADAPFKEGSMLRLSIEVPRKGYLYVIDREQYADGTLSDPYLIFPANPAGQEHRVSPGRVVEIPNQSDEQAYFEVKSLGGAARAQQVAEVLTLLITPAPLTGLPARSASADAPLPLSAALVEKWERDWGARVERLELEGGAGRPYTRAEQAAGRNAAGRMTQGDPLPQTILRLTSGPGQPLLVTLPLKIEKESR